MTNTAIASTQRAGEGDAVILGNNSQPVINTILKIGERNKQGAAQSKLLNDKQKQENATKFYQNLAGLKSKIWDADLPRATEKIDNLITKAIDYQKKGINPFDPQNMGAYIDLYGDIEKLQLFQEASKSSEQQYLKAFQSLNSDKTELYDKGKGITALQEYRNLDPLERLKLTIDLPKAAYNSIVGTDKALGDTMKLITANAKVLNDKGLVTEANDAVLKNKPAFLQSALSLHTSAIKEGRITAEQVLKDAGDYFDANIRTALHDPTVDENQKLAKVKEANLQADRKRRADLAQQKFQFMKSMSEVKSPEVDDLFLSIQEGLPVSSMALANQTIQHPTTGEIVVTGAFKPIKNKLGKVTGISIEIFTEDPNTGALTKKGVLNSPILDKSGNPVYSTTQIYKSAFQTSTKGKTPITNYTMNEDGDFEFIEDDQKPVGGKKTSGQSTSVGTKRINKSSSSGNSGSSTGKKWVFKNGKLVLE